MPSVLPGAVSLFVSEPRAATPRSARKLRAVGWSPALAPAVSQGPSSLSRRAWPVRTSRMSPSPTRVALLALRGLQILAEDVLARLQPRHLAQPWDVQQDPAAGEAVLEGLDRHGGGPLGRDGARGFPVVQRAFEADVTERVDVCVGVVVVVDSHVVLGQRQRPVAGDRDHAVIRRFRVVGRGDGVQRPAERDRDPLAHESGRGREALGREVVERPALVVVAPASPGAQLSKERRELLGGDGGSAHAASIHPPPRQFFTLSGRSGRDRSRLAP
jgi:hypothetical protein